MNFNSFLFFAFLIPVLLLHRFLPVKGRNYLLLIASYIFYGAANPFYIILLMTSTLVDFFVAQKIYEATDKRHKKLFLLVSILVNIGLLSLFKYADFVIGNFNLLVGSNSMYNIPELGFLLPVGISFYTFQTMSYTIDVYWKKAKPTYDLPLFALYVSFFPQLVAGPIERVQHLLPQLKSPVKVDLRLAMWGVERILWGLMKKIVFADRIGYYVNEVYAAPDEYSSLHIAIAVVGFMFQLYLDFSAYCDIAVGIARLLGIQLRENFLWPLASRNHTEFWNRWNITVTNWFKDYVYQPLGGLKRKNLWRSTFNIYVLFFCIGLWHGASWNFILFGLYAGTCIMVHQIFRIFIKKGGPVFGRSLAGEIFAKAIFLITTFIGGIFFRVTNLETILAIFKSLISLNLKINPELIVAAILVSFVWIVHELRSRFIQRRTITNPPRYPFGITILCLILILVFFGFNYKESFIYFQF